MTERTPTRRERRAAEREAGKQAAVTTRGTSARSPVLAVTLGALVVGLVVVVLLVLASGGMGGPSLPPVMALAAGAPPVELRDGRSLGDPSAPVRIEVWEDPQCPGCGIYTRQIEPLLVAGPVRDGKVHLTYRDMAFLGQESRDAAVGMRVAEALEGRFWDFHDIVYANQHGENKGAFSRDRLAEMAVLIGLDRQGFLDGLDDPAHVAAMETETASGTALGIRTTPTLVINGEVQTSGALSWEQLEATIDQLAAQGAGS